MNFIEGEVLLIDKPHGWTSFDVVNKIRWNLKRALNIKKIKVGHAGTLDPLATGLLIVCTGKQTKNVESYMAQEKTYTGTFLLGKSTPSFDLETGFDHSFPIDHVDESLIQHVAASFLGAQEQKAPIYSAKQIDGKRAYLFARAGKDVTIKSHQIHIEKFEVSTSRFPEIDFEISCTKGTYIRSIAKDFGERLNSGATLIALRRTASGSFNVNDARSVEDWITLINPTESSIP